DMLADPEIDAVLVCSSTDTHADISIEAAKAGKHVFCEKPVDLTPEKVQAVIDTVKEAGVKLQVGFNRRFDHNFAHIKELINEGKIGNLELVKITSRDPEPPSAEYAAVSGGIFLDMTIHDFDMACFIAGSEVEEIYVNAACLVDPAIGEAGDVDTAIINLKFKNGALGVIDNSRRAAYGYDQRVEAFGSLGAAVAANDTPTNVTLMNADAVMTDKPLYFFLERYMQSFRDEMIQFVDAVQNDKPTPTSGTDGLNAILIALAAKKSVKEGRPVKISEIL
ncbi:MAG: inositol 2-dehydrogenase, partial [Acutalibacteraceae bacterium]